MTSKVLPPPVSGSEQEQLAKKPKTRSLRRRAWATCRAFSGHARRHRRWFIRGTLFALLLVAVRVALPWPLQLLIKPWLDDGELGMSGFLSWHPALLVGLAYAGLVALLGYADYRLRLNFARFSIATVRDIREGILGGIAQLRRHDPGRTSGDLVTRLVGDSARLKAGMKGFLVHVATNGLLFIGISVVLLWMEWRIGLIFLSASILILAVTGFGASAIYRRAYKYRRRESRIADSISERVALIDAVSAGLDGDDEDLEEESHGANRSSGRQEAKITRIQGLTTWTAHLILAVAVPVALWVGYQATADELISISELFVVMLYALMILGPMVRLTRQGARCGKIMASADRLRVLHDRAHKQTEQSSALAPLQEALTLEGVKVRGVNRKERRLGPLTVHFRAGEKVAVLGPAGSGKSTLLSLLTGRENYKGTVTWDGLEFGDVLADSIPAEITIVDELPQWPGGDLAELSADFHEDAGGDPLRMMLKSGGVRMLRKRISEGRRDSVPPEEVSYSERKLLGLLRVRKSGHSLKLVDDPVREIRSNAKARKYLAAFLGAQGEQQTVIVALDRPVAMQHFDRVLVLARNGKLEFDGSVPDWQSWQAPPGETAGEQSGAQTNGNDHDDETPTN